MMIPIALGAAEPDRVPDVAPAVDWTRPETWEFFPLDDEAFPAVRLAREAGGRGGARPQRGERGVRRGVHNPANAFHRHRDRSVMSWARTTYSRLSEN